MPADLKTSVDLRAVAPASRLAVATYTSYLLKPGQAMEMTDKDDPIDLFVEFQRKPDRFCWEYLERGPKVWRVRVMRLRPHAETDARTDAREAVAS